MRLAILGSRGIPAKYGAFEVCAEKLGKGLVARGWQVTVFCPRNQDYKESTYDDINLEFVRHPSGGLGVLIYDVLSLWKASRGPFDAMLMLGYGAGPFFLLPKLLRTPLIVNTDGLEWKRSKWAWYVKAYFRLAERLTARLADRLVSDSIGIQRYYKEKYGVESSYIAYGTEIPDETPRDVSEFGVSPGEYYIVVMRMEPENSIADIVTGYLRSGVQRPLILLGPSTPFFERDVKPLLEGQNRARYLGAIYDRPKVFALRTNARAYVHGHTVGGTNPSLLEAMASGNFVIARDVEFNREVIGTQGRYFNTAQDLVGVLRDVDGADSTELRRAGNSGRERIRRDFQWDVIVEAYVSVIEAVAGAGVR